MILFIYSLLHKVYLFTFDKLLKKTYKHTELKKKICANINEFFQMLHQTYEINKI